MEQVRTDYKKRMQECADSYMRERVSEWVMDSCERVARETRDGSQSLLENSLRNKNANSKILAAALTTSK